MSTDPAKDLVARIDDLETRAAFQERTIEELHTMIAAQWEKIDRLARRYDKLKAEFDEIVEARPSLPSAEPPPPHY